jgi:hypothetical protein
MNIKTTTNYLHFEIAANYFKFVKCVELMISNFGVDFDMLKFIKKSIIFGILSMQFSIKWLIQE